MSDKPKNERKLPDILKIDEITSGKIDPQLIYDEIERLKAEINTLRNDMSLFLKALATIPPNQSQTEYYKLVVSRLKKVQDSIDDYCEKYNKLLPIINLAQIKLGHDDVEGPPPSKIKSETSTNNNTPNMGNKTTPVMGNKTTPVMGNKTTPVMGNSSTPSIVTANTNTAAYSTSSNTAAKPTKKATKRASVSNKDMGSSANQPIVI
ncbi:hypothetical protein MGQ_03815 [Candida albicans P76067]|nr:hypothetical protein MGQ_03815 [Candida albicans P76067]